LLTLLAHLALAVAHTWGGSIEAVAASAALAVQRSPTGTGDSTPIFKAAIAPRRGSHDPLLGTICQSFAQRKLGRRRISTGVFLLETSWACLHGSSLYGSDLDLTVAAPRAPPSLL